MGTFGLELDTFMVLYWGLIVQIKLEHHITQYINTS